VGVFSGVWEGATKRGAFAVLRETHAWSIRPRECFVELAWVDCIVGVKERSGEWSMSEKREDW
jgi:hypothetical protein